MRAFLYGLSCVLLVASAAGMALLPQLVPHLWLFLLIGAPLSAVVPATWLLLSATAGNWRRPRTGLVLLCAGLVAMLYGLVQGDLLGAGWAALVAVTGLLVTYPPFTPRYRRPGQKTGPVRAPLGRRGET
jgi:hypothetical protein